MSTYHFFTPLSWLCLFFLLPSFNVYVYAQREGGGKKTFFFYYFLALIAGVVDASLSLSLSLSPSLNPCSSFGEGGGTPPPLIPLPVLLKTRCRHMASVENYVVETAAAGGELARLAAQILKNSAAHAVQ